MPNAEHLVILKQGVEAWNQWRKENWKTRPDLSETDLSGANLIEADLSEVDLGRANLTNALLLGVNLIRADLSGADLGSANLSGANLSSARLVDADLSSTDLGGADLANANLDNANLIGARLIGADLSNASLGSADLVDADLSNVRCAFTIFAEVDMSRTLGLDRVEHLAPSTIGLDTFFKSKGKIPLVFLRGAGVPDIFIQYAASLTGAAFEFYSCFISYSSGDDAFAQQLHADLQDKGVRCWFAPHDLKIGAKFRVEIDAAIRVYQKLLVVLSKHSVQSAWVEKEVETAFEKERKENRLVLFPIRLDKAVMGVEAGWAADIRRSRHIGDFRNWKDHDTYAKAFERLLRDLKSDALKPDSAKAAPS